MDKYQWRRWKRAQLLAETPGAVRIIEDFQYHGDAFVLAGVRSSAGGQYPVMVQLSKKNRIRRHICGCPDTGYKCKHVLAVCIVHTR